jgi:hypothetical protein
VAFFLDSRQFVLAVLVSGTTWQRTALSGVVALQALSGLEARPSGSVRGNNEITHSSMAEYYGGR